MTTYVFFNHKKIIIKYILKQYFIQGEYYGKLPLFN